MLRVLFLLSGLSWLSWLWTENNSERLPVQITVPEKTHSVVSEGIELEVSYKIIIEGKTFILNLMQKTFLPYNFRVYGYNGTEIMKPLEEEFQYNHMGSDTAVVTQKIFQLIGLTNAIFTSFNTTVILSSLELWTDENKIPTTGDANELLHRFLRWKRSYLVLRPHDVAFLLTYREKSNYVGATFQGKMCDRNYGGGVVMHPRAISLESLAIILAQLLALTMGITYDDTNKCQCSGAICIMNPEAIHFSGVKMFSNCSMEDFAHFISKQKSQCLQNQPRLDPSYKQQAVCGNELVEQGEDCDCGNAENCALIGTQCCNGDTCRFSAGSKCAEGPCCDNCQYMSKTQICRSSLDECDLPEYCNGSSASCQEDLFVQNGHPCGQNQWVCIDGRCRSGHKQCTDLFNE
ncbi:disintegrin and metalloproteinase domain-containing protein 2 isoform 2 precursor, partial [Daubentonia madagascariensis]